jgi:hypothetical protein
MDGAVIDASYAARFVELLTAALKAHHSPILIGLRGSVRWWGGWWGAAGSGGAGPARALAGSSSVLTLGTGPW